MLSCYTQSIWVWRQGQFQDKPTYCYVVTLAQRVGTRPLSSEDCYPRWTFQRGSGGFDTGAAMMIKSESGSFRLLERTALLCRALKLAMVRICPSAPRAISAFATTQYVIAGHRSFRYRL